MKRKERRNLARQIVECEQIIASSSDKVEIQKAQGTILTLSRKITSLEDMMEIDVLVQEMLEQKNKNS